MARPKALDVAQAYAVRLMHDLVVPTFVLDPKRRVVVWNRACERLTGVLSSEVMGTGNHWRGFYERRRYCLADLVALGRPDKLEKLYPEHAIENETGRFSAENWCVMPRLGNQLYLAIDAGPIHDVDGNLIAVVETLRDMTDQKRAETTLQNLAAHDGLTGLANRRSFDHRLDMEWGRAQRARAPLTLMLADVDHFKLFNDVHGHQKGDDCLRAVAATMRSGILRPGDLAARYGGEEFAIIMPNTDLKGACKAAERLRTSVLDLQVKHGAAGAGRYVTMSMGVATVVPPAGVGPEWLLEQADQALYAAKDSGRNFVATAREGLIRLPQRKAGGRLR